jgi:hypothetical protein
MPPFLKGPVRCLSYIYLLGAGKSAGDQGKHNGDRKGEHGDRHCVAEVAVYKALLIHIFQQNRPPPVMTCESTKLSTSVPDMARTNVMPMMFFIRGIVMLMNFRVLDAPSSVAAS